MGWTTQRRAGGRTHRLVTIIENTADFVAVASADGRVEYVNPAGREMLGVAPDADLSTLRHEDLCPPWVFERTQQEWMPVALREGRATGEGALRAIDGREIPVSFVIIVDRDASGDVVAIATIARDISERRRAEERLRQSEERARFLAASWAVLDDVQDLERTLHHVARLALPVFAECSIVDIVTDDGRIERAAVAHADPAKEPLLQSLRAEHPASWDSKSPVVQVLKTGTPALIPVVTEAMRQTTTQNREHRALVDALAPSSVLIVPLIARGQTFGTLALARTAGWPPFAQSDVELAQELAWRAATAIDNARLFDAVRVADRRKDEFLATLAHELRNPLAPIQNAVALMELRDTQDPILQRARDTVDRQVRHMVRLIDDLLDISRITRGTLDLRLEPVTLAAVLERAVESVRPQIDAARHTLTLSLPHEPVMLEGDPVRLAQAFSNLLHNAGKFTEPGGRIACAAVPDGEDVVVTVRDNGIGIPKEHLESIFEMFGQVDQSLGRSRGGLGVGLALTRRLITLHGGSIAVRSPGPGRGSEFIVRLPMTAATSGAPAVTPAAETRAPARRVLVVDDYEDSAESLSALLRLAGHDVEIARDGLEAVQKAAAMRPDVVILDIGLPKMSGYDACRAIRAQPGGTEMLIVALTGWGQDADRARSKAAGFDRHFVKPLTPSAIGALLTGQPIEQE